MPGEPCGARLGRQLGADVRPVEWPVLWPFGMRRMLSSQDGRGSPGSSALMTQRPPVDSPTYLAMALQVAMHF
jgi:hypothetical protein